MPASRIRKRKRKHKHLWSDTPHIINNGKTVIIDSQSALDRLIGGRTGTVEIENLELRYSCVHMAFKNIERLTFKNCLVNPVFSSPLSIEGKLDVVFRKEAKGLLECDSAAAQWKLDTFQLKEGGKRIVAMFSRTERGKDFAAFDTAENCVRKSIMSGTLKHRIQGICEKNLIVFRTVNPKNTSNTCHLCGNDKHLKDSESKKLISGGMKWRELVDYDLDGNWSIMVRSIPEFHRFAHKYSMPVISGYDTDAMHTQAEKAISITLSAMNIPRKLTEIIC